MTFCRPVILSGSHPFLVPTIVKGEILLIDLATDPDMIPRRLTELSHTAEPLLAPSQTLLSVCLGHWLGWCHTKFPTWNHGGTTLWLEESAQILAFHGYHSERRYSLSFNTSLITWPWLLSNLLKEQSYPVQDQHNSVLTWFPSLSQHLFAVTCCRMSELPIPSSMLITSPRQSRGSSLVFYPWTSLTQYFGWNISVYE